MSLPKTNLRQVYHVACTLGEVVNGFLETRLSKLCQSSKINPWSKKKPVVLTTDAANHVKNGGDLKDYEGWEKGLGGRYGFDFPLNATQQSIMDGAKWEYHHPDGSTGQPFCLGFFAGYNHNAIPFLMTPYKENEALKVNRTTSKQFGIGAAISMGTDDMIGFDDFEWSQLNESIFCAIFKYGDYAPVTVNANGKLVDGATTIMVNLEESPFTVDREWDVYLALRTFETSNAYYPIPWDANHHFHFKLNIVSESPFDIICETFSQWLEGPYSQISDFAYSQVGGEQGYYPTRGPLYFRRDLTTKGDYNRQIVQSQLRCEATAFDGTVHTVGIWMYNASKEQITNVIVSPNQRTTIYIGSPYMVNPGIAIGLNTKVYSLIKFTYNNEIIFSTGLNLTYA